MKSLTPRELTIADHVADGLTDKQIARLIPLSDRTVGWYIGRIYKKLNIISRFMLISMVLKERYSHE